MHSNSETEFPDWCAYQANIQERSQSLKKKVLFLFLSCCIAAGSTGCQAGGSETTAASGEVSSSVQSDETSEASESSISFISSESSEADDSDDFPRDGSSSNQSDSADQEEADPVQKESEPFSYLVEDAYDLFTEEEEKETEESMSVWLSEVFSLIFTMDEHTEDYTETLLSHFTDGSYADRDYAGKIYTTLREMDTVSTFRDLRIGLLQLGGSPGHVYGFTKSIVTVEMENERGLNGIYDIDCSAELQQTDQGWELYAVNIDGIYEEGTVSYAYADERARDTVIIKSSAPVLDRFDIE